MYNNETGLYEEEPWMEEGTWVEDDEQRLYIIPLRHVTTEIEGPDGETLDALNAWCREHGDFASEEGSDALERMGLTVVGEALKRFNECDGYYHA